MNKKGQVFFYTLMLGIVVLVLALALATPVKESVNTSRTGSDLNCSNSSISNFDKGACIVADLTLFYFIGGLIFIGGAIITAKILWG